MPRPPVDAQMLESRIRARMFERGITGASAEKLMGVIRGRMASRGILNTAAASPTNVRMVGESVPPSRMTSVGPTGTVEQQIQQLEAERDSLEVGQGEDSYSEYQNRLRDLNSQIEAMRAGGPPATRSIPPAGQRADVLPTSIVEDQSWVGSMGRSLAAGVVDAGDTPATMELLMGRGPNGGVSSEAANTFALNQAKRMMRPISKGTQAFGQATEQGAGALLGLALERPGAFIQGVGDVTAQSFGAQAASLVGAPLLGPAAPLALGAGSGVMEANAELGQALIDMKIDPTDGGAVFRAMNNPAIRDAIRSRVLKKAGIVGAADLATMGVSSRIPGGSTMMGKAASAVAGTGVEMIGGAGGELLSQIGSGQEVQGGEVAAEALGELAPGAGQLGSLAAAAAIQRIRGGGTKQESKPETKPPQQPAETPEQRRARMQADLRDLGQDDLADRFVSKPRGDIPADADAVARRIEEELRARMGMPNPDTASGLDPSSTPTDPLATPRPPWQMTRAEWVGGGTVGRIKFGDVDQEFVESPQFDTPEEAKAWAASRGIANAQIQSSGKRGGPKLYKASGSTGFHRAAVETAHAAGKPVPPEVLAEYGLTPNPSAKPNSSTPEANPYAEAEQNLLRQREARKKARATAEEIQVYDTAIENIRAGTIRPATRLPNANRADRLAARRAGMTFDERFDANILDQRNARRAARAQQNQAADPAQAPQDAPQEETADDIAIRAIMQQRAAAKTKRQVRDLFRNRVDAPASEEQAAAFRAEAEARREKIRNQRTSPPLSPTEQQYQDQNAQRVARIRAQREDPNFTDRLGTEQWPAPGQIRGARGQWPAAPQRVPEGQQPGAASQSPAGGTSTASRSESTPAGQAATAQPERTPEMEVQETTRGSTSRTPEATAPDVRSSPSPKSTREPFTVKAYRGQKNGQAADERVGGGRFFSGSRSVAEAYARDGGEVVEETLTFSNPLITTNAGTLKQSLGLPPSAPLSRAIDEARKAGHDGIVMERMVDGPEYVDLSPDAGKKAPREPWQMTRGEYVDAQNIPPEPNNIPDYVREGMIAQGVNPNRLLNEIDATRKKTAEQLARDPLTKHYEAIGNTRMADRMRRGDLSSRELRIGLAEMKHRAAVETAHAAGKPVPPEVLAEYGLSPNPPATPNGSRGRVLIPRNPDRTKQRDRMPTRGDRMATARYFDQKDKPRAEDAGGVLRDFKGLMGSLDDVTVRATEDGPGELWNTKTKEDWEVAAINDIAVALSKERSDADGDVTSDDIVDSDGIAVDPQDEPIFAPIRRIAELMREGNIEEARALLAWHTRNPGATLYPDDGTKPPEQPLNKRRLEAIKKTREEAAAAREELEREAKRLNDAVAKWIELSAKINPDVKVSENPIRNVTVPAVLLAIDSGAWTDALRPDNKVSRALYEHLTGLKLPATLAATKQAVTSQAWKQQKPKPKPPTNKAEPLSGFNVGDEVYVTGDDGYAVTRVVEVKTMFGKPHLKLWNAEKWFAADDPRISKERPKPPAPKPAPPAPAPAPKPAPAPSTSKLSPEKQAELARLKAEFKKKLSGEQLNMGVDPELLSLGIRMAALELENQALKFADFAKRMIEDIGEEIRPYLKSIYMGASAYPGLDAAGLDNPGTVYSFDLESIQKEPTDEVQDNTDRSDGAEPGGKPDLSGKDGAPGGEPDADGNPPVDGDGAAEDAPVDGGESGNDGGGATGSSGNGVSKRSRGGGGRGGRSRKRAPATGPDGKPTEPGPAEQNPKVQDLDGPAAPDVPDLNHKIGPDDVLAPSGQKAKIRGNIRAIKLLKTLEAENRNPTPEEKKILAQYVGFGPIGEVVNRVKAEAWEIAQQRTKDWGYEQFVPDDVRSWVEKYYDDYKAIRDSVTRDEFEAITASTRNAHYTSKDVISGAIWPILKRLGFTGGNILETSAGIGHMIGLMPAEFDATSKWTAVELDNLTSRILAKLYPQANVLNSPFQTAGVRRNVFDAIVGNVPFARDVQRTDEGYPDFSLHNYFLAKSIDMLRPGGVMVVISSISSMDADASREWREWMNERADLVGAIRLPNDAFEGSANTKVTTDIMVFRKKDTNPWTGRQEFSYTTQLDTGEKGKQGGTLAPIPLNVYYQQHPEMMLGRMSALGSMYGGINQDKSEPTLEPFSKDYDLAGGLAKAVAAFPEKLMQKGDTTTDVVDSTPGTRMYSFYDDGGKVKQRTAEGVVTLEGQDAKIAREYMQLRDLRRDLVDQQVSENVDEAEMEATRAKLRDTYRAFVQKHGNVNDLSRGARSLLEIDSDFNRVASLENVVLKPKLIGQTKSGKPNYRNEMHISEADILSKRTQWPFREPTKADSWEDAVLISQFYRGTLSLPYVASLMGETEKQASIAMRSSGLVFVDPVNGQVVSKSEYLSGNIRDKLTIAEREAASDPSYSINVEALKSLIPDPMPLSKIKFQMGATWIPIEAYQAFADSMFGSDVVRMMRLGTGTLAARAREPASSAEGQANNKRFGTSYFSGIEVFKSIIEINPLVAYDEVTLENGSKSKRKNPEASADAELKADLLRTEFERWARTSESAPSIEKAFNDNYVAIIPRQFDPPPFEHFPGASTTIKLRDYQRRAVMRGVAGSYLNAHEVGMGKTFTGITTAMEWRRLGIAKKPLVVVQPSTYLQFAGSWNQLYPQANILVPTAAEMKKENRHRLIARIATGDWDGVVIPQTLFNQISVSARFASDFILGEIDALTRAHAEAMLTQTGRGTPPTAKKLQEQIDYLREYLNKKLDGAEADALLLDELGVDGLIVDEAHDYKNSYFRTGYTQLKGVNSNASERSLDMLLKTKYVQQKVGVGRNLVLMTGTPVSNTVGEAWVMMRYVRPDLIRDNNVTSYDDFASAFTDISAKEEFDSTNRLKPQLRMRGFKNVKQFQAVWLSVVDVVRYEQLPKDEREKINRPKIRGGKPTMIDLEPTAAVLARARALVARYEWFEELRGKERYQNRHVPGTINTEARKLAIDPRMVGIQEDHPNSKVNHAVRTLFDRWQSGKDHKTTQVLFSDLYQDNPDDPQFNVFEDIRNKLIALGVPKDEIVVALDLSDSARAALFQKVNDGDVRIVMGTTQKLGVGVNIQTRLETLHHLDAPYRPMDMEQREGRIIRFGNLVKLLTGNDPEIIRYGVKRTFDSGQYGRLERKQRGVNDTLSGVATESEVESSGEDMLLSFAEAAAAFSGNPDMLLKGEIEAQLRSLRAERSGFEDALLDLRRSLETAKGLKRDSERVLTEATEWKKNRLPVWEKSDTVQLPDGTTFNVKDDPKPLDEWIAKTMKDTQERWEATSSSPRAREKAGVVEVRGIKFAATSYLSSTDKGNYSPTYSGVYLTIPDELSFSDKGDTGLFHSGSLMLDRVSQAISSARGQDAEARKRIQYQEARIADLEQKIPTLKFDKEAELLDLEAQLETVLKRLRAKKEDEISSAGPRMEPGPADQSGGGAGDASPSQPQRSISAVADRLERWADEQAKALFGGGMIRRGPRGSRGGSTTLPADVGRLVGIIGARAVARTIKGGVKLTELVRQTMAEFPVQADPVFVRKAVRKFLKAVGNDPNKLDPVFHDLMNPPKRPTRAERRAAALARRDAVGRLTAPPADPATVGSIAAQRAALRAAERASETSAQAAVREIRREVSRAYRAGVRTGRRDAEAAIPGLMATIIRQRKQLRALAAFEARGAREEMKGKMADAQAVRDGIRDQALQYAKTLPSAVRGKLVGAITSATTPMAYLSVVRKLQTELFRFIARDTAKWIDKRTRAKRLRKSPGMTDALRRAMVQWRSEAGTALQVVRAGGDLSKMRAALVRMLEIRDLMGVATETAAAEYKRISGARKATAFEIANETVADIEASGQKDHTTDELRDHEVSLVTKLWRGLRDVRNVLQDITGQVGSAFEAVMWKAFDRAEEKMYTRQRELRAQAERVFKDAGWESMAAAQRELSGRGGDGSTKKIRATFGGQTFTITLGDAIDLLGHMSDPMTAQLFLQGEDEDTGVQGIQSEHGKNIPAVYPTPSELEAFERQVDPDGKYRRMIDALKDIFESTREETWRSFYILKGFEPEAVERRWPRSRNLAANLATAELPEDAAGMVAKFIENDGRFKHRSQTTGIPILLRDPVATVLDEISTATRTIYLAVPTRDAANVLLNPRVATAITSRWGKSLHDALKKHLLYMSRAERAIGTPGARAVANFNSWRAVSSLGLNPGTWAVTAISAIRLFPELGPKYWAKGLAGAKDVSMAEMMRKSGHAWDRYEGAKAADRYSSVAVGDVETPGELRGELAAAWANVKAKDKAAAFRNLQHAARTFMAVLNWFDGLNYRLAWAAYSAKAADRHPEWSQARRDRWVAMKARAEIRETQQGSSPIDMAMGPARARETALSAFTLFGSDTLKSRNRIRRAFRRGYGHGLAVLSAEVTSVVMGHLARKAIWYAFSAAVAAALGWDDDDAERLAEQYLDGKRLGGDVGAELANLVLPFAGGNLVNMAKNQWGAKLLSAPAASAAEETVVDLYQAVRTSLNDRKTAADVAAAWGRFANQAAGVAGVNPLEPWMRRVLTEVEKAD